MKPMSCTGYDNETYYCPECKTTDYTEDWRCPHCGNYIHITAKMPYERNDNYKEVCFIRKTIDEIEIGDDITHGLYYIYTVLSKMENYSKNKKGCSYRLSLRNHGSEPFRDNEYYNCVLSCK